MNAFVQFTGGFLPAMAVMLLVVLAIEMVWRFPGLSLAIALAVAADLLIQEVQLLVLTQLGHCAVTVYGIFSNPWGLLGFCMGFIPVAIWLIFVFRPHARSKDMPDLRTRWQSGGARYALDPRDKD